VHVPAGRKAAHQRGDEGLRAAGLGQGHGDQQAGERRHARIRTRTGRSRGRAYTRTVAATRSSTVEPAIDEPRVFPHGLDPALFTPDRIDHLCRTAPPDTVWVRMADTSRERIGWKPVDTDLRFPVVEDALARDIQVRIFRV